MLYRKRGVLGWVRQGEYLTTEQIAEMGRVFAEIVRDAPVKLSREPRLIPAREWVFVVQLEGYEFVREIAVNRFPHNHDALSAVRMAAPIAAEWARDPRTAGAARGEA